MLTMGTIKGKVKEVSNQGYDLIGKYPYKAAATFAVVTAAISITAAYFLSPACAAFVGALETKATALVSPAVIEVSKFLVTHPLVACLVLFSTMAALIALPLYIHKNNNRSDQIDAVKEVLNRCEKDKDTGRFTIDDGKVKLKDSDDPLVLLTEVGVAVGVVSTSVKAH